VAANDRPPTIEEVLRNHNIELTKTALLGALRNENPEIRWLAAQKLAQAGFSDTIPEITDALRRDSGSTLSQVNIALALAKMGSTEGFAVLTSFCENAERAPERSLLAARYLLDLARFDCRARLIYLLQGHFDDDVRVEAATLLSRFAAAPTEERKLAVSALISCLTDKSATIRLNSAIALANLGDPAAAKALSEAINREKESAVRSQMLDDLKALERKKSPI
jgi:HEAT repeat protein